MNIFWNSWSPLEAKIELNNIRNLPLINNWFNAHTDYHKITRNDLWGTTNGENFITNASFKQFSWYAESFYYLQNEYNQFKNDNRYSLKFHFNPNFLSDKTMYLSIFTWWQNEMKLFEETVKNKKPEFIFGMVLGKKPEERNPPCYLGWMRPEVVKAARNRSFRYYGYGWDKNDPNYGGEAYIQGHRGSPMRFHDARVLMTKAKFVWALENTHDSYYAINYLTEKIFHGFISASIPIYAGAWNVEDLIDPNLFIDLRKFNYDLNACMDYCEKMSEIEYQGYLDRIGKFLSNEGLNFTGEKRFIELDRKVSDVFDNKTVC